MVAIDTNPIKEKIISIIKLRGPCLPIHISKEINQSILFTSAFLSELLSENRIKVSNIKIGNSPVYFLNGQQHMLEKFSKFLNYKEKQAFELLKEKKVLKDKEQEPAIRVALRSIKDFAVPIQKNNELYWRYFLFNEKIEEKIQLICPEKESVEKNLKSKKIKKTLKSKKQKAQKEKNEKFFNKVKEFLKGKKIEIVDIVDFNKKQIILKTRLQNQEKILVAINKKKIEEKDIIQSYKKIGENKKFSILSFGEPLKKTSKLIESIKHLENIEKINKNI